MSAPLTREQVSSAIQRRWPAMPRADVTLVLDAIYEAADSWGLELCFARDTTTYVGIWGRRAGSPTHGPTVGAFVLAYVHLGQVAIIKADDPGGGGWHMLRLTNYVDTEGGSRAPDFEHQLCTGCNAQLPLAGDECGVCGQPVT
jgi:hypothetical protein